MRGRFFAGGGRDFGWSFVINSYFNGKKTPHNAVDTCQKKNVKREPQQWSPIFTIKCTFII